MRTVTDMTRGNPVKLMLSFAVPVILTNLGQQFYQIADAAIVGRGVGVDALAAVGCTDWIYWMILWSMQVMTAGFATFVSRFFGKRDYRQMNRAIVISAALSGGIALVLTVVGLITARPLLRLLGTPENILRDAVVYLSTMIAGTLIMTAYNLSAAILRAFGDGRSPLIAMILAAVLNILLDLFCVFILHWGVFGAAIASVTAQLAAFLFCLFRIRRIEYVSLDRQAFNADWALVKEILFFGLPLALQYIIINLGGVIVQSTINAQGSAFIAGYTAINKLYGLLECTALSLGSAFTTFASQNFGAGNFRRMRKGVNTEILLTLAAAAGMMVIVLPLNRVLPQVFLDVSDADAGIALDVAGQYLIRMGISMPILYLLYVYRSNLQAIGNASWSLISGIAEALSRVLMAKLLFLWIGAEVLFWVEPVAWVFACLFVLVPYYVLQKTTIPHTDARPEG